MWLQRVCFIWIPVLSLAHVSLMNFGWKELISDSNLIRPWLLCYPLCQLLLTLAYNLNVREQVENDIIFQGPMKIDKVIGREEVETEEKTCCHTKTQIVNRNICEAVMYTIQPRF